MHNMHRCLHHMHRLVPGRSEQNRGQKEELLVKELKQEEEGGEEEEEEE